MTKKITAAPKDASAYTYFKLQTPKLTITRRGKNHVFRKGDPLGWRLSSKGTHIRLVSPLSGPTIVFSLRITDESLAWLDKQDPNAKHKRVGMKKSDKPEDSKNVLEGFVVTDGKWFYRLTPEPLRTKLIKPRVIYKRKSDADYVVRKFKSRGLSVKEVWTKDLDKPAVKASLVTAGRPLRHAPSAVDLFREAEQAMLDGNYTDFEDQLDFVVEYCRLHYETSPHFKTLFKDTNDLEKQAEKFLKSNTASTVEARVPGKGVDLDIKVHCSSPEVALKLSNLLAAIEHNCQVGHSATVGAFFDGDGADFVEFKGLVPENVGAKMADACGNYGDGLFAEIGESSAKAHSTHYKENDERVLSTKKVWPQEEEDVKSSNRLPGVHPAAEALLDEAAEDADSKGSLTRENLLDHAKELPLFKGTLPSPKQAREAADAWLEGHPEMT